VCVCVCVCMDGWMMDGQMIVWMNVCMDGCMDVHAWERDRMEGG